MRFWKNSANYVKLEGMKPSRKVWNMPLTIIF